MSSRPRLPFRAGVRVGIVIAVGIALLAVARGGGADSRQAARQPAVKTPMPTAEGAVTAAVGYLDALDWQVVVDAQRRRRAIERRAMPGATAELDAQLAAPAEAIRAAVTRGPVVARSSLLGYRVEHFDGRDATVELWGMALFGSGAYRPTTQWSTSRMRLVWRGESWLVAAIDSRGGPAPDAPVGVLARAARRFREFHDAP